MSDGHYDAPAYCAICDCPIATGPICADCRERPSTPDAYDHHVDRVIMNIRNGNLVDAVDIMMNDGEGEPILVALDVVKVLINDKVEMHWHTKTELDRVIEQFIGIISIWLDR